MSTKITPGAIRFNTDSMKLEYYHLGSAGIGTTATGEWVQITTDTPEIQTGGTRGLVGGGYVTPSPGKRNDIDYFNIDSTGNSIDFGTLSESRYWISSHASRTRGVWGGGGIHPGSPNKSDTIDYVTIASTGNATDFGNLTVARYGTSSCSNQTRGIFAGGYAVPDGPSSTLDTIDYITIASTGDANDFGNLTVAGYYFTACASSTRGVFLQRRSGYGGGGYTYHNTIDYVTISTQGNAADFGDATATGSSNCAASNSIRGILAGNENGTVDTIQYVTISTLGNALDFGNLLTSGLFGCAAAASPTRVVIGGGYHPAASPATQTNEMQYVQIMSTGDAVDFGDLTVAMYSLGGCSNGHGGLG